MKIDRDGCIEWERRDWEQIRCPSSDTSLRIRCDGEKLQFSGNVGRFQQTDNVKGIGVVQCVERFGGILRDLGFDVRMFGSVLSQGTVAESGTTISRVDLAGNFKVSDYKAWSTILLQRPIFRRQPRLGKYGPTWGYESRRANWWKAKVYDKQAEQDGKRGPYDGATLARFEIQLGSEYLKREGLNYLNVWNQKSEGEDMAQVIYGRFLNEIQREQVGVEDWSEIPFRLRTYAILWRDGQLPQMSRSTFFRVRSRLKDYGIDISVPCNVLSLSKRVRSIDLVQVDALRQVA
nr:phage/plasmid replication protein [Sterolibacterium denitrificans]